MRCVRASGVAVVLATLTSAGIILRLPGVNEFIAVMVGAVAGVTVWSAVMHHGKARVEQEGAASLHYTLIGDRLKQGLTYLDRGQFRRAMAFFNRAIESEPDPADAYFGRGLVYHELEQHQQAIDNFDRTIEIAPDHPYTPTFSGGSSTTSWSSTPRP